MTSHSVRVVADAIARYLATRPGSADSAEGIQQWWLRPSGVDVPLDVVTDALRLLETEKMVDCLRVGARELWRPHRGEE